MIELVKAFSSLAQRHINKQTVLRITRTVGLCPRSTVHVPGSRQCQRLSRKWSANLESREFELFSKDPNDGDKFCQFQQSRCLHQNVMLGRRLQYLASGQKVREIARCCFSFFFWEFIELLIFTPCIQNMAKPPQSISKYKQFVSLEQRWLTTSRNPSLKWIKIAIPKLHLFSNVISLGIELVTSRTESRDIGHSAMSNSKSY